MTIVVRKNTPLAARIESALAALTDPTDGLAVERALDIASPTEARDTDGRVVRAPMTHYLRSLLHEVQTIINTDQIAAWIDVLDADGELTTDNLPATAPAIGHDDIRDTLHRRRLLLPANELHVHPDPAGTAVYTLHVKIPADAANVIRNPNLWRSMLTFEYTPIRHYAEPPAPTDADRLAKIRADTDAAVDTVLARNDRPCPGCEDPENADHAPGCLNSDERLNHRRNLTRHYAPAAPVADDVTAGIGFTADPDAIASFIDAGYVAAEATALAAALYAVDPTSIAARRVLLDARAHMEREAASLTSARPHVDGTTETALQVIVSVWTHRLEHTLPEPHPTEIKQAVADTRDALLRAASLLNAL